jgi:hypothetical protein
MKKICYLLIAPSILVSSCQTFFKAKKMNEQPMEQVDEQLAFFHDPEIDDKIAAILYIESPKESSKVFLTLKIDDENKFNYEYSYQDKKNSINSFYPSEKADEDLTISFKQIQEHLKKTKQQQWKECNVAFDVETLKYEMNYKYE